MAANDILNDIITSTKAQIVAYQDAIIALTTGGVESYTLDTGQTVTKVTKQNLTEMQQALDGLINRCVTLEARLNGSGVVIVRPAF